MMIELNSTKKLKVLDLLKGMFELWIQTQSIGCKSNYVISVDYNYKAACLVNICIVMRLSPDLTEEDRSGIYVQK